MSCTRRPRYTHIHHRLRIRAHAHAHTHTTPNKRRHAPPQLQKKHDCHCNLMGKPIPQPRVHTRTSVHACFANLTPHGTHRTAGLGDASHLALCPRPMASTCSRRNRSVLRQAAPRHRRPQGRHNRTHPSSSGNTANPRAGHWRRGSTTAFDEISSCDAGTRGWLCWKAMRLL